MKTVGTAELKARLSHHLRDVRNGETLVILDRDRPIARVVPYSDTSAGLVLTPGKGNFTPLGLLPPIDIGISAVDLLREERGDR